MLEQPLSRSPWLILMNKRDKYGQHAISRPSRLKGRSRKMGLGGDWAVPTQREAFWKTTFWRKLTPQTLFKLDNGLTLRTKHFHSFEGKRSASLWTSNVNTRPYNKTVKQSGLPLSDFHPWKRSFCSTCFSNGVYSIMLRWCGRW